MAVVGVLLTATTVQLVQLAVDWFIVSELDRMLHDLNTWADDLTYVGAARFAASVLWEAIFIGCTEEKEKLKG